MFNTEKILKEEFELIKADLIKRHEELGMKASGNWINNLMIQVQASFGILWGEDYTEQLVSGREPGKFPPISAIEKWIDDKPVIADEISKKSLAFLIARKIAREGTEYYKQGGTDLVSSVITDKRIQKIIDRLGEDMIFQTEIIINEQLKV